MINTVTHETESANHSTVGESNRRTLYIPSKVWKRVDEFSRRKNMSKSKLVCLLIEEAAHLVEPPSLRLDR